MHENVNRELDCLDNKQMRGIVQKEKKKREDNPNRHMTDHFTLNDPRIKRS